MNTRASAGAGLVALILLGGCTSATGAGGADAVPVAESSPAAASPTTSAAPSPSPSPSPSSDPRHQRVLAANQALAQALFALSAKSSKLDADGSLRPQRQAMAAALSAGRTALTAERGAAYGAVRSCSGVLAGRAAVAAAAQRAAAVRTALLAAATKLRADSKQVDTAKAAVLARLAELQAAVKDDPHPPAAPAAGQVQAALTAEAQKQAEVRAAVSEAGVQAAEGVANAAHLRANAEKIAVKAC